MLQPPAFTPGASLFSYLFPCRVLAVGFILCHSVLNSDATALSLWKLALQSSTCLCLFRDEVFHIHKAAEDLFVNIRGYEPEIECKSFFQRGLEWQNQNLEKQAGIAVCT